MNSTCPDCSKVLRNPKKCACGWTLAESKYQTPEDHGQCGAHGCPMPGSINSSVTGGGLWLCHMHFRASSSNWHTVTQRIRARSLLVNLIHEIRKSQNGTPFDYRSWLERLKETGFDAFIPGNDDRRPNNTLSMRMWLNRLEKTLFAEVMPGMEYEDASAGTSSNSEEIMNQIEAFLKNHRMGGDRKAA